MLRKYSQRTIKLYSYHNREFLEFSDEMSNEDIRDYLYHLASGGSLSNSFVREQLKHKAILMLIYSAGLRVSDFRN